MSPHRYDVRRHPVLYSKGRLRKYFEFLYFYNVDLFVFVAVIADAHLARRRWYARPMLCCVVVFILNVRWMAIQLGACL